VGTQTDGDVEFIIMKADKATIIGIDDHKDEVYLFAERNVLLIKMEMENRYEIITLRNRL